ncbi:hypothetical protein [Rhodanobacter sp. MP1X3]|uniref:hypothetical protein n=1 Tax=Rhodanobacter sp. MP1X3 TaxID=2723086 RepID=UPI0016121EDF|nr:hypothetical protein [Rhodanobacter sp. MP1X3]MBB6241849.1 putative membrane protein [Rhodanobacter sp. MP1X3]
MWKILFPVSLAFLLMIHLIIFWIPVSIKVADEQKRRLSRRLYTSLLVSALLLMGAANFSLSFTLIRLIKPAHPVIDSFFVTIVTGVLGLILSRLFVILSRKKQRGVT